MKNYQPNIKQLHIMNIAVPFKQVDVFTTSFFKGNPVAVINFMDSEEEVPSTLLQSIANWTNLSETTFLFKPSDPKNDYRLRIFTPNEELPFAGHPTIGSCRAFLEFTGRKDASQINQECKLGVVRISVTNEKIAFEAVKADIDAIPEALVHGLEKCISTTFKTTPKVLHVGPEWVVGLVEDSQTCFNLNPDFSLLGDMSGKFGITGLVIAGKKPDSSGYEMRAFAPSQGVNEDPVCGSGCLAFVRYLQDLYQTSSTTTFDITQGGRLQREGKLSATIEHGKDKFSYHVGGQALTIINGMINI